MSNFEQREEHERERLERIIERLVNVVDRLLREPSVLVAVSAKGKLDTMQNATKITFTEFDANGTIVPITGKITFASDNPAAVTIDGTQQSVNADGSVSCPVVSVAGATGTANITGVDSSNSLAAGDADTVGPVALPAVKAVAVLS